MGNTRELEDVASRPNRRAEDGIWAIAKHHDVVQVR